MTRIAFLIERRLKEELTPEEHRELEAWLLADPANSKFISRFEEPELNQLLAYMSSIDWQKGYDQFINRNPEYKQRAVVKNIRTRMNWVAAAAILLLLSGLTRLILQRQYTQPVAVQNLQQQRFAQDVLPGGSKATLTIGNQQPIMLDTLQSGLTSTGQLLNNQDGLLQYNQQKNTAIISFNTVTTPNGGTYRVVLPDGTRVWLNAASYIQFPSSFTGKERLVTISGEVYFEVAKDPVRKFIVQSKHARMEVLGTHFNVSDYNNDPYTITTLLEGSVAVSNASGRALLQPGYQAVISQSGATAIKVEAADPESSIAWKNGQFIFNGSKLPGIMRQVERWYNVQVVYEADIPENFVGVIRRDEPLSKLLQLLELTGEVHFSIEGKTIKVRR